MPWDAIGAVGEVLGAAGVIVTLVYLAVQLRQNTRAMQSATFQTLSVSLSESARMAGENPHLLRAMLKAENDPEAMSEEERASFHFLAIMALRRHEAAFVQRRLRAVDPALLDGFMKATLALFASPHWRAWWDENKGLFLEDFQRWLDAEIESGRPESIHFFIKSESE